MAGLPLLASTLTGALTWLTAWGLLFPLREQLARLGVVDVPSERSLHRSPTPRGGGLPIVALTLVAGIAGVLLERPGDGWSVALFALGSIVVAAVSFADDVRGISVGLRLTAHFLVAGCVVVAFGYFNWLPGWPTVTHFLRLAGVPLTLLWIVGLTNAFNFMDGIDGIAGSESVVVGFAWVTFGAYVADPLIVFVGAAICGSSLGFLMHNWPPAKIFMGDVGSAFLGVTFAILPCVALRHNGRVAIAGTLVVWPFVCDAFFTFCRRLWRRENVLSPHRSHIYQRLVLAGWRPQSVSLLYAGLSAAEIGAAWVWLSGLPGKAIYAVAVPFVGAAFLVWLVARSERAAALKAGLP